MNRLRRLCSRVLQPSRPGVAALLCAVALPSLAAPFEIAVSPSRFELDTRSGARIGRSLDIYNVGNTATEVSVRTLDWSYSEDGNITYHDELQPDSCRPWTTLEHKSIKVAARSKAAFRFQVDIPAAAPRGECRLMLAFEGIEPATQAVISQSGMSLNLPVSGRIAVAIYLSLNDAQPRLSVGQLVASTIKGRRTPVITVTNSGDAHGRLEGSLDAVDANGVAFELAPEGTPVMPGQTRALPLSPKSDPATANKQPVFPIKVRGSLDWEKGAFKIEAELQ